MKYDVHPLFKELQLGARKTTPADYQSLDEDFATEATTMAVIQQLR